MLINHLWARTLILLVVFGVSTPAWSKYTPEQVKAVYLYRIATFIQWDQELEMNRINICVADDSEIQKILVQITRGKQVRNKPLNITDADCDVLYISERSNLNLLAGLPKGTVTIGGMEQFTNSGGAIELVEKQGKIKPKVNLKNISGYQLSSNFLRVAEIEGGKQ
ncbi:YfiR family protein [Vibrio ouci]|uniref:YfiR family protein n=1 Tax=Vibrio ouci TaxID=2499078 RepID=A0A4Y8WJL1_9VIBR|nr:YfiR family protein [Vibrio ouci]TFH92451.1 YfiR family protein [Vibrio ouci]